MTSDQLTKKMKRRQALIQRRLQQTARGIGIAALRLSKQTMTEGIYSKPIPKRPKSGKPMWRRTGFLRRSEAWEVRGPTEVAIVNTAEYAEPRHEAGKPGRRNARYVSHWQDEMAEVMRPIAVEQWRETVLEALKEA